MKYISPLFFSGLPDEGNRSPLAKRGDLKSGMVDRV
jgi:hypothetical protein